MSSVYRSISGLLAGVLLLMLGAGLLGSLVPIRMGAAGVGDPVVGAVTAGYFLGLVLGAFLAHRLISLVGHVRAFVTFASLLSAAALLHPLWTTALTWGLLRVVAGLCMAGLFMCIESWLNEHASDRSRGQVLSVYMVIVYVAQGFGQQLLPVPDRSGYALFVLSSVLVSLAVIAVAAVPVRGPRRPRPTRVSLAALFRVSPFAVTGAVGSGLALGAFYGLAPLFTVRLGMSLSDTALFMTATIVGGVLLQWPLGALSDRLERRIVLAGVAVAVAAVAIAIVHLAEVRTDLLVYLAPLFGGFIFTIYPISVAQANDRIERPEERVSVSGGLIIVYGLAAAVGPLLGAWTMSAFGASGLFLFIAFVGKALAAMALFRVWRRAPVEEAQKDHIQMLPRTTPLVGTLDPRSPSAPPPTGAPGPHREAKGRRDGRASALSHTQHAHPPAANCCVVYSF